MNKLEFLEKYKNGERNFCEVNLNGIDLSGETLCGADFIASNFIKTNFNRADLRWTDFRGANLRWASFYKANLEWSNLSEVNLYGNDLNSANLINADLSMANLDNANLTLATLSKTDLSWANLENASLRGTCLDSLAKVPEITDDEIISAGLKIEGDFIIGWRIHKSLLINKIEYVPGKCYSAQWFSVDKNSSSHPGISFNSIKWIKERYQGYKLIRVAAKRCETVHAGDEWRTKRLIVLPYED